MHQATITVRHSGTPINISNDVNHSITPVIVTQGNNVYIVWSDTTSDISREFLDSEILFAVSNNNGQTFSAPVNLSNNAGKSFPPEIAVQGNNVYVSWADDTPNRTFVFDRFFAVSNNNGQTFSPPINLGKDLDGSGGLIATQGNNVYVVCTNAQVHLNSKSFLL